MLHSRFVVQMRLILLWVIGIFISFNAHALNTAPVFNNGSSQSLPSICENSAAINITNYFTVSDIDNSQTETWTLSSAPNHGGSISGFSTANTAASGSTTIMPGNIITYTPANNYFGAESFSIQVSDGLASATINISITVNQSPTITTPTLFAVCSGLNTTISLTATVVNSNYTWSLGAVSSTVSGAAAGSGNLINQTLVNSSNALQGTVVYNVVATSQVGNCASAVTPITVQVNPTPIMNTATPPNICSGTNTNISLSATTASTFSWTYGNNIGNISGATSGSGTSINQVLNNPANTTSGSITYIVTPVSSVGNCVGPAANITEVVNPAPQILNAGSLPICSGQGPNINLTASIASNYSWTVSNTSGGISGASASSGSVLNQVLNNPQNNAAGTVTYSVIPVSIAGGCLGAASAITITVNPLPTLSNSTLINVCSGNSPNINLSASMPSTYAWSLGTNTGNITGASPGFGSTINQLLNNPTNNIAGSIIYNVVPTSTILGSCVGNATSLLVTVNPLPILNIATTDSVCSGISPNFNLNASVASNFSWTIGNINGGITGGLGASGNVINQVLNNPNHVATGSITYLIVPTSVAGNCVGSSGQLTIKVFPQPLIVMASGTNICSGTKLVLPISCSTPSSFTWTAGNNIGNISGAHLGAGDTLSDTLVNPSNSINGSITYFISAVSDTGLCLGPQHAVLVTVYPKPILANINDTICHADTLKIPLQATCTSTYAWLVKPIMGNVLGASSGADSLIKQALFNLSDSTEAVINYLIVPTSINACIGDTGIAAVWINPAARLAGLKTITICSEGIFNYQPISTLAPGFPLASFNWQRINANCYDTVRMGYNPAPGTLLDSISSYRNNGVKNISYACTLSYNLGKTCSSKDTIDVIVNPRPQPANIFTHPANGVCPNTMYQNFGINPVNSSERYLWQSIVDTFNATIYAQGIGNRNALVSFSAGQEASYTAFVAVRAAFDTFSCYSYTIDTVYVQHTMARDSGWVYLFDHYLVYQDNTVSSYLWGYDRKGTLDSGIFYGANYNQSFELNAATDTMDKYIWVITVKNGCLQKTYYNAPQANTLISTVEVNHIEVSLYPNPANSLLQVELDKNSKLHYHYIITDITGHAWQIGELDNLASTINISNLASGYYLFNCMDEGQRLKSVPFIKR